MPIPRIARVLLYTVAVLAVGALGAYFFLQARGNDLLQTAGFTWLGQRVAVLSDSVYIARVYNLRYAGVSRSLRFDSVTISTDVRRNLARRVPLPTLTFVVKGGRLNGIDVWEFARGQQLTLDELVFDSVGAIVVLPSIFKDSTDATPQDSVPSVESDTARIIVVGGAPERDARAPLATVKRVRFGDISGRLVIPAEEKTQDLVLDELVVEFDQVSFDPRRQAKTPFHVQDISLAAKSFDSHLGETDRVRFHNLRGSFADSTLALDSFSVAPRDGDLAFFKHKKYRATRTAIGLRHLEAEGIDWNGMFVGRRFVVRKVVADGFELDLLLDKRWPKNPARPSIKPTPQQRIARLSGLLRVDSVLLRNSRVQYGERADKGDRPGRIRFEGITGAITNLTNDPALQSARTPLRLDARAKFQGSGPLAAVIEFPLLAPRFDANLRASMGPMDARKVNEMLTPLTGVEIKEGQFQSLEMDMRVRNGVYGGTFVPRYRKLGVSFPQSAQQKKQEKGIGGFFKGVKRGAMGFAANVVVRTNNPAKEGKPPSVGRLSHRKPNTQTFWAGIWQAMKPALKESVVNIDL
ncbi:MAG: DUF748 domain-containing protein [Gemmatimonadales bacterium]|jgi:hypothetical protein|nr:DUF748 domain-containing protein [Gemmatimonadales bacterium]